MLTDPLKRGSAILLSLLVSTSLFGGFEEVRVNRVPLGRGQVSTAAKPATPNVDTTIARIRETVRNKASRVSVDSIPQKRADSALAARTDVSIEYRANGTPRQIRGRRLQPAISTNSASPMADAIATAREFLRENRGVLRLDDPDRELALIERQTDDLGRTHVRFAQQYAGLDVWPAEVIVHLDAAGDVDLVDGAFVPTPRRLRTLPMVAATDAIRIATTKDGVCEPRPTSVPTLIVHARGGKRARLAWTFAVEESIVERWHVVIDAQTGAVLERFNDVETAKATGSGRDLAGQTRTLNLWQEGSTFYLLDASKPMFDGNSRPPAPQTTRGAIFIADANNLPATSDVQQMPAFRTVTSANPNSWPVPDAVSAAFLLSSTFDYYLERHNRNSIDGRGGSITGIIRIGRGFENAFWNDEQQIMGFGDADTYAGSLDVIAHEMTHGVTNNSARLVYQGQSGAINEAMSDIFGEMAEHRQFGSNDWLLGTGMRTKIRSMSNPGAFGDPRNMSEFVRTSADNGGVHINSGIINHAYYQLVQGLPGAIGVRDAERIFYRTLTQHLTKDSQFIDLRLAAIASAEEIFGAGSVQARKTAEAFDKVEIFSSAPLPDDPPIPVVNGTDSTLFIFRRSSDNAWFLARREIPSDNNGAILSRFDVGRSRPSISRDGELALFVDSIDDVCFIPTDGSQEEQCLGFPQEGIRVASVSMSPDGVKYAFVLKDAQGDPEDRIIVVDIESEDERQYVLSTPSYDGVSLSQVVFADAMTFTSDSQFLVYDAFTEVFADGAAWGSWSLYALELNTNQVFSIVPPTEGLDVAFPLLGHTSDDLLTFEAYDPESGEAGVFTANINEGIFNVVAIQEGVEAVPSYTGDDRRIVFASGTQNATGALLASVPLAADHITATGQPTLWLPEGAFSVIYRRGVYSGPTTKPGTLSYASSVFSANEGATATITVMRLGGNKGQVTVRYATANGSANDSDYFPTNGTLTWPDGDTQPKTFQVRLKSDAQTEGNETVSLTLTNATNGATLGSPATATISIVNQAPSTSGGKRRASRH